MWCASRDTRPVCKSVGWGEGWRGSSRRAFHSGGWWPQHTTIDHHQTPPVPHKLTAKAPLSPAAATMATSTCKNGVMVAFGGVQALHSQATTPDHKAAKRVAPPSYSRPSASLEPPLLLLLLLLLLHQLQHYRLHRLYHHQLPSSSNELLLQLQSAESRPGVEAFR